MLLRSMPEPLCSTNVAKNASTLMISRFFVIVGMLPINYVVCLKCYNMGKSTKNICQCA